MPSCRALHSTRMQNANSNIHLMQRCQVLAAVGDQAPTNSSDQVLASLDGSLSRAESLLAFILRPYGFSRRWLPLPVSSKLLRQVTEIAAVISEQLEEGGDALMDLLPVGVSMLINSTAARACWRKWRGAHVISGSKKKMKGCLGNELSKAYEAYSSIHFQTQHCHPVSHSAGVCVWVCVYGARVCVCVCVYVCMCNMYVGSTAPAPAQEIGGVLP